MEIIITIIATIIICLSIFKINNKNNYNKEIDLKNEIVLYNERLISNFDLYLAKYIKDYKFIKIRPNILKYGQDHYTKYMDYYYTVSINNIDTKRLCIKQNEPYDFLKKEVSNQIKMSYLIYMSEVCILKDFETIIDNNKKLFEKYNINIQNKNKIKNDEY